MYHTTQFEAVNVTDLNIDGLVGNSIAVSFMGHQVALVGATPEAAAAAFEKLSGGMKPDMTCCQKVVIVPGEAVVAVKGDKSMADRFRMAYRHDLCPDKFTRPAPPHWLRHGRVVEYAEYNLRISYTYWTKLYWATPPWLDEAQLAEMAAIYKSAGPDDHVDHQVPLKNELVCGLHVPWNLQVLPAAVNMSKSNKWWDDHPFQQRDLFA